MVLFYFKTIKRSKDEEKKRKENSQKKHQKARTEFLAKRTKTDQLKVEKFKTCE